MLVEELIELLLKQPSTAHVVIDSLVGDVLVVSHTIVKLEYTRGFVRIRIASSDERTKPF
jgi:hypothetical protein